MHSEHRPAQRIATSHKSTVIRYKLELYACLVSEIDNFAGTYLLEEIPERIDRQTNGCSLALESLITYFESGFRWPSAKYIEQYENYFQATCELYKQYQSQR